MAKDKKVDLSYYECIQYYTTDYLTPIIIGIAIAIGFFTLYPVFICSIIAGGLGGLCSAILMDR
jgi:hypothetical protein